MNTYKFKTNINCSGCIANVTPHLNKNENIREWTVDVSNPNKILTVVSQDLTPQKIKEIVEEAGYKAESISE
jgi:copper chaperone CopZ